ncbi:MULTISPECIES: hypothetical protein [unclassified Streptomyces]|uniref:hypothetical protein n=1 Tax=unclassified Streptomyces TaxID=2593676 RepID=UPI00344A3C0E
MTAFGAPVVMTRGQTHRPLVVLLHGRGSHEGDIIALANTLPDSFSYAALRAPIAENGGYAWVGMAGGRR